MTTLKKNLHTLSLIAAACACAPVAAQAQIYGAPVYYGQPAYAQPQPAPLYPYVLQRLPNGQVVQQPVAPQPVVRRDRRRHSKTDPALVEELRQRGRAKQTTINTMKIVRDPPLVIEKQRIVEDPTIVIERRHYVDDSSPKQKRRSRAAEEADVPAADAGAQKDSGKARTIRAEAEVTILGPDRMTIRLFRKRRGTDANAQADQ